MAATRNENEVLKVEDLSFSYGNASQLILEKVSFCLLRSEPMFLLGPGGSGKTTLLKTLAGLYLPKSGEIKIQGAPLTKVKKRERELILSRVAMTFQRSGLFDSKSVLENLLFPLRELTELTRDQQLLLAKRALEQVELTGNESKFPFEMSGGMQKRLGIARALVVQPELILYDDPTAGLDPITSRHIIELIMEVHIKKNTGTLIVSSDVDLALEISKKYSGRIAFLFEGKIIQWGTSDEIVSSSNPVIYQFIRGLLEGPLSNVPKQLFGTGTEVI